MANVTSPSSKSQCVIGFANPNPAPMWEGARCPVVDLLPAVFEEAQAALARQTENVLRKTESLRLMLGFALGMRESIA